MTVPFNRPPGSFRFAWGGMKLNARPDAIPAGKYAAAVNVRSFEDGTIQTRPGLGPGTSGLFSGATVSTGSGPFGLFTLIDSNNTALRKVTSGGIISTLALTSTDPIYLAGPGFLEPWGGALDSHGNLYVADFGASVIYRVSPALNVVTVAGNGSSGNTGDGGPATSAELNEPWYVVTDAAGNLYISDAAVFAVRAVNMQATTQVILGVSIAPGNIAKVAGNGTLGSSGDGGPAIAAEVHSPIGMALNAAGDLFILDQGNLCVRKVDHATGIITTVVGVNGSSNGFAGDGSPAVNARFHNPIGISTDAAGNLYITDALNQRVRAVNMQATTQTILGVSISAGDINTVVGNGTEGYSGDGGPATSAEITSNVWFVLPDSTGALYVCDTASTFIEGNFRIRKVSPAGIISTVAGSGPEGYTGDGGPATSATLSHVFGMVLG